MKLEVMVNTRCAPGASDSGKLGLVLRFQREKLAGLEPPPKSTVTEFTVTAEVPELLISMAPPS